MENSFLISILLILISIFLGYFYLIKNFNYWKKRGVNGPTPKFLYGTFPSLINKKQNLIYDMEEIYYKYKKTDNIVGVFSIREPQMLILSPAIIHEILVNKFKSFHDNTPGNWVNRKYDQLVSNNPFLLTGEIWKQKRAEITPALTTNRIKASFPVMQQVCKKMTNYIKTNLKNSSSFDTKNICTRFTAETVSDCIYGIESGSFSSIKTSSPIYLAAEKMLNEFLNGYAQHFIASVIPIINKLYTIRFFSNSTEIFFTNLMNDAIKLRINSQINRSDFVNYLIQLKEKKNLTNLEMTSHTMTFFLDGFETSATLMTHCLLLLARNPVEQKRLRNEIEENLEPDGSLSFEKLNEMIYLDLCIQETLRIFTPLLFASKTCTEPVQLDNGNNRIINIKVGDILHIPFHCIHNDAEYFENPNKFLPERFSKENGGPKKYKDEGKFLPFGDGPRICLGMKFALTQAKAAVCETIKNFDICVNERTRKDNYISRTQSLIGLLEGGIWLNYKEIQK